MPGGDEFDIAFGPYRLDRQSRSVTRDGVAVPLGGRAFDTLAVLAAAAGATVGKAALLDAVWPGLTVEENNLQVQIAALRKALDEGWIVTVPGRGYRLTVLPSAAEPSTAVRRSDRPSIVVLPFQNMSGDPEQEYFADGMVEDITTALSRTGWLLVIGRNSAFTYKDRAVDLRQVGRELGVRYVLEGSVRRAGGCVRIACQLVEAATGGHVWADRFEGELADVFALQDRITESIVGAIEPSLQRAEIARAAAKPTASLDAYDLYLQALHQYYLVTEPSNREARRLLHQAISVDPGFGLAKALAAFCVAHAAMQVRIAAGDPESVEAITLARSALANSPDDPSVLRLAGHAVAVLAHDLDAARAALDRAITLNANSAQILGSGGWVAFYLGNFDVARDRFSRAMRLSPLDPELYVFQHGLAGALTLGEPTELERALDLVETALVGRPDFHSTLRMRIFCLVKLGRLDEARERARQYLAVAPHFTLSSWRAALPHRAQVADAMLGLLRQAGLPE